MFDKFMKIKNMTSTSADLYIYGDIMSGMKFDDTDVTPEDVRDFLKDLDAMQELNIYVNSGGGSVFAGMAIYNMLKRHQANKTVYVDGVAASIASVIALAGDKIVIPSNAFMMIHKPWTIGMGNADDFMKLASDLEAIESGIMNVYEESMREGNDIAAIRQMVAEETWLNGKEAAEYFNVEVVQENNVAACASERFKHYAKFPDDLEVKDLTIKEEEPPQDQTWKLKAELDLLNL